jgi:hypothetical protein
MACQDLRLAHPIVREKPVGRFRIRPVLASKRDCRSDRIPHQFHQLAQPLAQSFIGKATAGKPVKPVKAALRCGEEGVGMLAWNWS